MTRLSAPWLLLGAFTVLFLAGCTNGPDVNINWGDEPSTCDEAMALVAEYPESIELFSQSLYECDTAREWQQALIDSGAAGSDLEPDLAAAIFRETCNSAPDAPICY